MVVDNELNAARKLVRQLKEWGYPVVAQATSGTMAVMKARSIEMDAIIMDVELRSEMDGITAALSITKDRTIPIVFLGTKPIDYYSERLNACGKHLYLDKNGDTDTVRESLESLLQ
jgi:CheY-like chemotaxis protein